MERSAAFDEVFNDYVDHARRLTAELVTYQEKPSDVAGLVGGYTEVSDQLVRVILGREENPVDEEAAGAITAMIGIDLLVGTQAAALAMWSGEERAEPSLLSAYLSQTQVVEARDVIEQRRRLDISREEVALTLGACQEQVAGLIAFIRDGSIPPEEPGAERSVLSGPGGMPKVSADETVMKIVDRTTGDLVAIASAAATPFLQGVAAQAANLLSLALQTNVSGPFLWATAASAFQAAAKKLRDLAEHVRQGIAAEIPEFAKKIVDFAGQGFGRDVLNGPLKWKSIQSAVNAQLIASGASRRAAVEKALGKVRRHHWWSRSWMFLATKGLGWLIVGQPLAGLGSIALLVLVDLLLARDFLDTPDLPDLFVGVRRGVGAALGGAPVPVK
jgi:hypothetical protein